ALGLASLSCFCLVSKYFLSMVLFVFCIKYMLTPFVVLCGSPWLAVALSALDPLEFLLSLFSPSLFARILLLVVCACFSMTHFFSLVSVCICSIFSPPFSLFVFRFGFWASFDRHYTVMDRVSLFGLAFCFFPCEMRVPLLSTLSLSLSYP